jgi:DNA-binding phage protein
MAKVNVSDWDMADDIETKEDVIAFLDAALGARLAMVGIGSRTLIACRRRIGLALDVKTYGKPAETFSRGF